MNQSALREQLYAAHRPTITRWWDADGRFVWPQAPEHHGGFRAILWHCLSYLGGDAGCVRRANAVIRAHHSLQPCHFAPGAAIDLLLMHRERLEADVAALLRRYLELNLQYMSTEDLKIHGYNDNHPFKAMHALILGGELLGSRHLVEVGLHKLRQAVAVYRRNGLPCEYNSPTYTPVSLVPLAHLAMHAQDGEARDIALRIERFFWQDLALHWDPRAGLPAGPLSRGYTNDHTGKLGGISMLLAHLFPQRFPFSLADELFATPASRLIDPATIARSLPFFAAHPIWYASADFHFDAAIERAIFERPAGTCVRGTAESGTWAIGWDDPAKRPEGAPRVHHAGPRRSLCTTWFGRRHSLGTAQYSWLDNGQAHGFLSTIAGPADGDQSGAAVWFARMFFDERCPYPEPPHTSDCFRDDGDIRTLQHRSTALVLYQPHPLSARFKRLRTGVFRPLLFTRPKAVFIGETAVPAFNLTVDRLAPVAIDEGTHYVGIVPLRLTDRGNCRKAHLQITDAGGTLAVLISSFEGWGPQAFTYEQIIETGSGFAFEIHDATDFASFADFRRWLAAAAIEDEWYADMRTTTYRRQGLELATCYSPYQSTFRFASINGAALEVPTLAITGMPDPGHAFCTVRDAAP